MKAYTNLEQSKKLAEILPFESADMCFNMFNISQRSHMPPLMTPYSKFNKFFNMETPDFLIPCWSLAALLGVLECPTLAQDKIGDGKTGWMVSAYPNGCRYDSNWYNSPIDACVEMIIKLHELKML